MEVNMGYVVAYKIFWKGQRRNAFEYILQSRGQDTGIDVAAVTNPILGSTVSWHWESITYNWNTE